MTSTIIDRTTAASTSVAVKAPVKAVALTNITLSGEQTVNGTAVVTGDRVLATNQTSSVDNGIYVVSTSAWTRSPDFDGARDVVKGTLIAANNGSSVYYRVTSSDPVTIGTSAITFQALTDVVETPYTSVDDYGADPTGVASSSAAFDLAFEAGGNVRLTPGATYLLATEVAATVGDLHIDGTGATVNCSLADAGTYQAAIKLTGTSASRISIQNLELAYTGAASGETLYGINIPTKVESVRFDNVKISGFRYYAAEINASQQTHVNNRIVDNYHGGLLPYGGVIDLIGGEYSNNGNGSDNTTGYGVVLSGTDVRVRGGRFADNDRYGIDGRRANNLVVDGAYVYNSGYVGIYAVNEDAEKDASNIKVVNCTVDNNNRAGSDFGIWVGSFGGSGTASPNEILVGGNTVRNTLGEGVIVGTGTGSFPPKLIKVVDNFISESDDNGIVISGTVGAESVIVRGNQLQEANEIQVVLGDVAQIIGNSFTYAGAETRLIYSTATTSIIKDNVVNGTNTSAGVIELTSTNYIIADNWLGSYCRGSATFNPASLADGAGETTTVTVTGAALGDYAQASFSLDTSGITITAWVSAADTVSVRFQNESGGPLDIGSGTLRATVRKVR